MSISAHRSLFSGKSALCGLALAGLALVAYFSSFSLAGAGYQFRSATEFRLLAQTPMKAQDGSEIALGYRVTTHWFFLPYAMTADGYALQIKGKSEPIALDSNQVRGLQNDRLLGQALPGMALTWGDRLLGSLLWIVLLPMLGWLGLRHWFASRKAPTRAAAAPQVPVERIAPKPAAAQKAALAPTPAPVKAAAAAPAASLSPQPRPAAPAQPAAAQQPTARGQPQSVPVLAPGSAPQAQPPAKPAAVAAPAAQPKAPAAQPKVPAAQPKVPAAQPKNPAAAAAAPAAQKPAAPPPSKPVIAAARIKCRVKSLKAA